MKLLTSLFCFIILLFLSPELIAQGEGDNIEFNMNMKSSNDTNINDSFCTECAFIGIKTNLLYYAVLAPNIEVEVLLNKFSLNFEYQFPWYVNSDKRFAYQFLHFGFEGRYWIKRQKIKQKPMPYTGGFIGIYSGLGLFDLQNSDEGTQGDINILVGISGGYTIYLNRSFNLEFSLGLGYLNSNNKNYSVYEDLLLRKSKSKFTYYGPTKAKVSLVWFINNKYFR
ncbi:MAG: DUF3575 domain-containing protein [Bacteroidales bacterium]